MLIYGHKLIKTPKFRWVKDDEFDKSAVNCFTYDERLVAKAKKEGVEFALLVKNGDEILLANALQAKFILTQKPNLAKKASKMAEFYLFDSKILLITPSLNALEKAYKLGVDGVILKEIIKHTEC